MNARIPVFLTLSICATPTFASEQTLRGTISDIMCGASHAGMPTKMTDRECTQFCAAKGAQYVIVSDGNAEEKYADNQQAIAALEASDQEETAFEEPKPVPDDDDTLF
jgi:hypothetical protein